MAGRMALILHARPTELLGFEGTELEKFLVDAVLVAQALAELGRAGGAGGQPSSTRELVAERRAGWRPPRRWPRWAS
ncbi:hypothetical protein DRO32_00755 [Candidatus Bathyarchaeota archaeon]|nr:MAG: hypothetical protein DRO32_00755 [Candidatus Bathyarchaeota archaeon]